MFDIYKTAFTKRMKFVYEIVLTINSEDVDESLKEAEFFVDEIKKFLKI